MPVTCLQKLDSTLKNRLEIRFCTTTEFLYRRHKLYLTYLLKTFKILQLATNQAFKRFEGAGRGRRKSELFYKSNYYLSDLPLGNHPDPQVGNVLQGIQGFETETPGAGGRKKEGFQYPGIRCRGCRIRRNQAWF